MPADLLPSPVPESGSFSVFGAAYCYPTPLELDMPSAGTEDGAPVLIAAGAGALAAAGGAAPELFTLQARGVGTSKVKARLRDAAGADVASLDHAPSCAAGSAFRLHSGGRCVTSGRVGSAKVSVLRGEPCIKVMLKGLPYVGINISGDVFTHTFRILQHMPGRRSERLLASAAPSPSAPGCVRVSVAAGVDAAFAVMLAAVACASASCAAVAAARRTATGGAAPAAPAAAAAAAPAAAPKKPQPQPRLPQWQAPAAARHPKQAPPLAWGAAAAVAAPQPAQQAPLACPYAALVQLAAPLNAAPRLPAAAPASPLQLHMQRAVAARQRQEAGLQKLALLLAQQEQQQQLQQQAATAELQQRLLLQLALQQPAPLMMAPPALPAAPQAPALSGGLWGLAAQAQLW
ncbi:MAG: hypothetical protein J3K34DRAFT_524078 [Monoraphidium minutum]|nr:MAG: hypothetical protein J3K34DRAFT_524078 [Monoraphidium minutum]